MPTIEWETPQDFFETLDQEFHFTLDVCATSENTKCQKFFTKKEDGLRQNWSGEMIWLNPPYDRSIAKWIAKAHRTAQQGGLVVALISGKSTDTIMWHDFVMKSDEIRFVKDRLHFGLNGIYRRANLSSIIVIFRPFCKGPPRISSISTSGRPLNSNQLVLRKLFDSKETKLWNTNTQKHFA